MSSVNPFIPYTLMNVSSPPTPIASAPAANKPSDKPSKPSDSFQSCVSLAHAPYNDAPHDHAPHNHGPHNHGHHNDRCDYHPGDNPRGQYCRNGWERGRGDHAHNFYNHNSFNNQWANGSNCGQPQNLPGVPVCLPYGEFGRKGYDVLSSTQSFLGSAENFITSASRFLGSSSTLLGSMGAMLQSLQQLTQAEKSFLGLFLSNPDVGKDFSPNNSCQRIQPDKQRLQ